MSREERRNYKNNKEKEIRQAVHHLYRELPSWYSTRGSIKEGEFRKLDSPIHNGWDIIAEPSENCPKEHRESFTEALKIMYNNHPLHSSGKEFRYCDCKRSIRHYHGYDDKEFEYYYKEDKTLDFEKVRNYVFKDLLEKEYSELSDKTKEYFKKEERLSWNEKFTYDVYRFKFPSPDWVKLRVVEHFINYEFLPYGDGIGEARYLHDKYINSMEEMKWKTASHKNRWKKWESGKFKRNNWALQ